MRKSCRAMRKSAWSKALSPCRPLRLEPLEPRELLTTAPIVSYVIRTLEPGTDNPINSILAGRDFDLEVLAQDLRNDGDKSRGVYSAFLDLKYDTSLANVRVAEIQRITFNGALTGTF